MNTGIGPQKRPLSSTDLCRQNVALLYKPLHCALIFREVKDALLQHFKGQLYSFMPGNWIVVKGLQKERTEDSQVLLMTALALKTTERAT